MSISPLGGASWNVGFGSSSSSRYGGDSIAPSRFLPNDPRNKFLTSDDRKSIQKATGMTFGADGGIMSPVTMSFQQKIAVLESVGQIAADRANGTLTGNLGSFLLDKVLLEHGAQRTVNVSETFGIDTRA